MVNKKNKKGAVELSLNLIIMLVIGLTVLGLVIAFVTNFLGKAQGQIPITQDDKTKIDQAIRLDGNFAFLSSTLGIEKGDNAEGKLYAKIRNPTTDQQDIFAGGENLNEISGDFSVSFTGAGSNLNGNDIEVYSPPINLEAGATEAYPILVKVPDSVEAGTYFATFKLTIDDKTYSQTVTVEVK